MSEDRKLIPQVAIEEIPERRIKSAEAYGTWGGGGWRQLYDGDILSWADNEIRRLNKILKEKPGDEESVVRRDICFQWRNEWLGEYNGPHERRVDSTIEDQFMILYNKAFEDAHKNDSPEEREKAEKRLRGWHKRRELHKQAKIQSLPPA